MNSVSDLHQQAMDLYEEVLLLRRGRGATDGDGTADAKLRRAYELERQAALSLREAEDREPLRSVLFRSAATLAFQCGEYRDAERLIAYGLIGNPPAEIAQELRDLIADIDAVMKASRKLVAAT